ncbi:MAG: hypothetical protein JRI72_04010 [Deltaproteobacteria bacterium]|nr:hypothetical protein [Deltaproteobacteria bacterium]
MIDIPISKTLNNKIEEFIQDDFIKREFCYKSVQNFVISAIEGAIEAERDIALMGD